MEGDGCHPAPREDLPPKGRSKGFWRRSNETGLTTSSSAGRRSSPGAPASSRAMRISGANLRRETWLRSVALWMNCARLNGFRRLVATKKTDRERDYEIIRMLAEIVFHEAEKEPRLRRRAAKWLARESRSPDHLRKIADAWPGGRTILQGVRRTAARLAAKGATAESLRDALRCEQERWMDLNREYWKPFIVELRAMRRGRKPTPAAERARGARGAGSSR